MLVFYMSIIDDEKEKSKFELLYNQYRNIMMSVALGVLHNKEDAEDAVHNTFIALARNMKSIGDVESTATKYYVIKATRNTSINMLNKNKKHNEISLEWINDIPDNDFVENLDLKQRYNDVVKAISSLDDTYRDVLFYHFVSDMTSKQIADLLGKKHSTIKQQLVRGKKILLSVLGGNDDE